MLSDRGPVCLSVTLVYCGKTVGWIKMKLGTQIALDPSHIVLDGDPAPPKRGTAPNFRPMSVVATRLDGSRIKMPLGMEVGLGPGHIVLDGDPAPLSKRGTAPNFRPMSVVAKRLDGSRCHLVGG